MLFADVGVELSARATEELLTAQPQLTGLSETPDLALRRSASPQRYRVHLKGLFKRTQL